MWGIYFHAEQTITLHLTNMLRGFTEVALDSHAVQNLTGQDIHNIQQHSPQWFIIYHNYCLISCSPDWLNTIYTNGTSAKNLKSEITHKTNHCYGEFSLSFPIGDIFTPQTECSVLFLSLILIYLCHFLCITICWCGSIFAISQSYIIFRNIHKCCRKWVLFSSLHGLLCSLFVNSVY